MIKIKALLIGLLSAFLVFPSMAATETKNASPKSTSPTVAEKYEGIEITVNINTAGPDEIATQLSGIGEKKAQEIVTYREEHGPFMSADELTNIKGIGPATVEKNRQRIEL